MRTGSYPSFFSTLRCVTAIALVEATCLTVGCTVRAADTTSAVPQATNIVRRAPLGVLPTERYQQEAVRLMIEGANSMARDLKLHENLPITRSNIIGAYVGPPGAYYSVGRLGSLSTSNYEYCFTYGRTVSEIYQQNLAKVWQQQERDYKNWPISRRDTNAAFEAAMKLMTAAGIDVDALNRECRYKMGTIGPKGFFSFVPDYRIDWFSKNGENFATFEFLEPTLTIRALSMTDSMTYATRISHEVRDL